MTNRRYKLGFVWVVLVTVWFAVIVGGLSVTDIAYHVKEGFGKNGKDTSTK